MTRLEQARRKRKLLQGALGERTGFTQAEVSMMENHKLVPSEKRLQRLAKYLKVPVEELFLDHVASGWRPAASAPQGGKPILGWNGYAMAVVEWSQLGWVLSAVSWEKFKLVLWAPTLEPPPMTPGRPRRAKKKTSAK